MAGKKGLGIIGEIIPAVFRNLGINGRLEEARLAEGWGRIVGELLAERSNPVEVRLVEVCDNAWMQELRFHQKRIIEKIQERFPGLGVTEIRLRMKRAGSEK
jgi:predicted nucleic acid-binding Zn ribbon protein